MISVHKFEHLMVPRFFWFDLPATGEYLDQLQTNHENGRWRKLTVRSILVKHEGISSLHLSLENRVPKLLGLDDLLRPPLLLILGEQLLELFTVDFVKTRGLRGTEERPIAVGFHTLHEKVGDPEGVE